MIQVYRFYMNTDLQNTIQLQQAVQMRSPLQNIQTEVIISYTAETTMPNRSLEKIARLLITQSIVGWLKGEADLIDEYVSVNVLRDHLFNENLHELAAWVDSFNDVSMHNLNDREWTCVWIIFS